MKFGFVFPGQGSQSVGMLSELGSGDTAEVVIDTFAEASDAIDVDLWHLAQNGPEEQLNDTAYTQPALLAAGVATWRAWLQAGGAMPSLLAGHSLGEVSALVASDALDLAEASRLVHHRGRFMQAAVPAGSGAMAAVLGLDQERIEQICDTVEGIVSAANINAPGQVVIAGQANAVAQATNLCKKAGAKRALPLAVSVPSHCCLLYTSPSPRD